MGLILQIIGGIVLAIVVLIIGVYLYFRFKFGKWLNFDPDSNQTPLVIHLNEDHSSDWLSGKPVKKVFDELCNLGFQQGKAYTLHEMKDYQLLSLFNPPYVAVLYQHPIAGVWVDIVANQVDGTEVTVSNAPNAGFEKEHRPGTIKNYMPDAQTDALFEKIREIVESTECVSINNENFRAIFEESYNKDMAWRNRKGGISYEEFLEIERGTNWKNSEKTIKETFLEVKENELHQWHDAALRVYKDKYNISDDMYYESEYLLLMVPVIAEPSAFISYLCGLGFVQEDQEEKLISVYGKESNIYLMFDVLNNALSPDLRAKYVGKVDFPIECKIFKQTEERQHYNYG